MSKRLRFLTTVFAIGVIASMLSWFKTDNNTYTFCSNVRRLTTVYHGFPLDYYGGSNAPCHYTINRAVGLGVQFGVPGNYYIAPGNSWSAGSLVGDVVIWSVVATLVLGSCHRLIRAERSIKLRK